MNICIFSKNRAMQLDLLLRSLKKYFKELDQTNNTIIYKTTTDDFKKGYGLVKERHPEFRFVEQRTFKYDVLDCVDEKQQFTMFLVDDIVFKAPFSASNSVFGILKNNNQMINLSLRLHKGIDVCYALNKSTPIPKFVRHVNNEYIIWKWPGLNSDWGYGISLDGDISNTSFIKPLLRDYNYENPNQLEATLNNPSIIKGFWPIYKCCYDGPSKLINNPANRVQNEFQNRVENNSTPEELNDLFLSGKTISLNEDIENIINRTVHYPFDYKII